MHVLIIEDDAQTLAYIAKGFSESGHTCKAVNEGNDGLFHATNEVYDVVIIDRMLPHMDGISVLKKMRASDNQTPVLILSALGQVDDRVEGLRAGGDDYLTKPFAFTELLVRVEGLARRGAKQSVNQTTLSVQDLDMNLLTRKVTRAGQNIDLQSREFRLLEYILRRKGQIVTRTMLLEGVWDYHFDPQTNVIDVHISRLRSKIDKGFSCQIIKTVRNAGYIIED
jgi:two-component system OmpR family response regulator